MKLVLPSSALLLSVLFGGAALAQQLDYGRYEEIFGEPVTISATGRPERLSNTPVIMDVITAEDIGRSGARDVPTLLRRLPGIDLFHASQGTPEVSMGGYVQPFGSRYMVLLNGRQVYFDGFGETFWASLPVELEEIRQIEVVRGPQSALYGFNAVDGVINIVTFDPVDDKVNAARLRLGNHARRDVAATTTQSLGDGAGVRLTVADDHAHDGGMVVQTPANLQYLKDPDRRSLAGDFGVTLGDGSRLGLEASHTDIGQRGIAYNVFYDARIKTDSVKGSYTAETPIGQLNGTAYYTLVNMPWVNAQPFTPTNVNDHTIVAQVSDLFKIGGADSFRLGVEARHLLIAAGNLNDGAESGDLAAGSTMWQHDFSPQLSMVNALRYDYFKLGRTGGKVSLADRTNPDIYTNADFDRSLTGYSVNSALVDKLGDDDSLRLTLARGLKLPTLANFGSVQRYVPVIPAPTRPGVPSPVIYFYGNPDLLPSAVYDYELGWDHDVRAIEATTRVNVFHEMTMSHIGTPFALVNGQLAQVSMMSTGSVADGLRLQLEHKAKEGWVWGGNYTYERLHEHFDWGFHNNEPLHKINANLGYARGAWEFDVYGGYTSATKNFGAILGPIPTRIVETVKGYGTLAPRIAWHASDNLTLELVGENLWTYQDTIVQRTGPGFYASAKVTY